MWFPLLLVCVAGACMFFTARHVPKMWSGHVRTAQSGKAYLWECQRRRNGSPSVSRLGITAALPYNFILEEEKWSHRLSKRLGFCEEFQTMNEHFDHAVYILSDDARFQQKLRGDTGLHAQFTRLFHNGVARVQATPQHVVAQMKKASDALPESQANEITEALYEIKQRLSSAALGFERQEPNAFYQAGLLFFRALPVIFCSAALLTVILIAIMRYSIIDWSPLVNMTMQLGGVIIAFGLVCMRLLYCNSSYGHSMLMNMLFVGIAAGLFATGAVLYFVNCEYDRSPTVTHRETVASKHISRSKRSKTYYLRVADWNKPNETISVQVRSSLYDQMQIGARVRVYGHAGLLGMEWISGLEAGW